jgi:hypothetical protein
MPPSPGATAPDPYLDLLLDFADNARSERDKALARGDRRLAEQWDEYERMMLRYAYEPEARPIGRGGGLELPGEPGAEPGLLKRIAVDASAFINRNFPKEEPPKLPSTTPRS